MKFKSQDLTPLYADTKGEVAKVLVDSTNGVNYAFVLVSDLCCDSYVGNIKVLSPTSTETVNYKFFVWTSFPDGYEIISKKRFQIKTDSCCFRDSPETDDEYRPSWSDHEEMPVYGNTIARLKEGSTGIAYAKFKDESENLWWFVALDTNARVTYNRFYRDTLAYKCGWVDSKFLEIVE